MSNISAVGSLLIRSRCNSVEPFPFNLMRRACHRFSANTPTVWAGIAPTPVAGTAVEKGDSPMARVGVQATSEDDH